MKLTKSEKEADTQSPLVCELCFQGWLSVFMCARGYRENFDTTPVHEPPVLRRSLNSVVLKGWSGWYTVYLGRFQSSLTAAVIFLFRNLS